ncbi:SDR family NAD(P)-dependent oxidoreductase [Nitrincola iocasae]|uniref:SDR family NAD(P)-dependent oxidoreductase n=1 Tax=Nitrincola iocasae TaxID=2614693 RepID=A0A5J6LD75_9GAMM|nr:SDR family NAD(P)-dependent oxidoreductase [Nitrincola iocasae]QEW06487.1 SDR family NAD(P)-dependent oxidoreductase [Nitrincola iocasae]
MSTIYILGGGAIGSAVARLKASTGASVTLITRHPNDLPDNINQIHIASWDWHEITQTLHNLALPDQFLVTNGLLWSETQRPEKRTEALTQEALLASFSANVLVTAACLQHVSGRMKRDTVLRFMAISAKVGSISDNRLGGWYAYRTSKAALNMLVKTTAIEWQRRFPLSALATYHPGTTASGLSEPFQQRVPAGQLKTPEDAAHCLVEVINSLAPEASGQLLNWDGNTLAF